MRLFFSQERPWDGVELKDDNFISLWAHSHYSGKI